MTTEKSLATLIDQVDDLLHKHADDNQRAMVSCQKTFDVQFPQLVMHRNQLMCALKDLFFEKTTKALRRSQLFMFCHDHGYELISHHQEIGVRSIIQMRLSNYDLVALFE